MQHRSHHMQPGMHCRKPGSAGPEESEEPKPAGFSWKKYLRGLPVKLTGKRGETALGADMHGGGWS